MNNNNNNNYENENNKYCLSIILRYTNSLKVICVLGWILIKNAVAIYYRL